MNVIEKLIHAVKTVNGEISINSMHHSMTERKFFIDKVDAEDFVTDDSEIEDEFKEDFENIMYEYTLDVEYIETDSDICEVSVNDLPLSEIEYLKYSLPNFEVKEMIEKIDGVYSTKKVLVEKITELSKDKEILKEMYDTVSKEFDENPNYDDDDTIDGVPIGNRPHPEMKEVI
jgi:hypothetical protein